MILEMSGNEICWCYYEILSCYYEILSCKYEIFKLQVYVLIMCYINENVKLNYEESLKIKFDFFILNFVDVLIFVF